MKTILSILMASALLFLTSISTSYAYGGGGCCGCCTVPDTAPLGCGDRSPELGCDCADPGIYYNNCISRADYCEAFGNIGAR